MSLSKTYKRIFYGNQNEFRQNITDEANLVVDDNNTTDRDTNESNMSATNLNAVFNTSSDVLVDTLVSDGNNELFTASVASYNKLKGHSILENPPSVKL